jgi:hypothetical protein
VRGHWQAPGGAAGADGGVGWWQRCVTAAAASVSADGHTREK